MANKVEMDILGTFPLASASAPCCLGVVCFVSFAGKATDSHSRMGHCEGDGPLGLHPTDDFCVRDFGAGLPWLQSPEQQREEETGQLLPLSFSSKGKNQKQVT